MHRFLCLDASRYSEIKDRLLTNALRSLKRPNLRRIASNAGWLSIDHILRMVVGFIVVVWLARYLGPHQYGILNYAVAFVFLFSAVANLGLEKVVVRELIYRPEEKDEILGSAFLLKLSAGALALAMATVAIVAIRPGDGLVQLLVLIVAAGFIFQAFGTVDLWFQSQTASKHTVVARGVAFFIANAVKIFLLLAEATLVAFAIVATLEILLGAVGVLITYRLRGFAIRPWSASFVTAKTLLKDSWPLLISGLAIMIYMRMDQIMLGEMIGDKAVGIYSAAVKLTEVFYFIPTAIVASVFPSVLGARKLSRDFYHKRLQMLYDAMAAASISIAVVITLSADVIIRGLYGPEYQQASPVLSITAWTMIPVFLGVASSQYLVAENQTKGVFYRTLVGCIANVILNLAWIPEYGVTGAAWATFVSYCMATFCVIFSGSTRRHGFSLLQALNLFRLKHIADKLRQKPVAEG